MNSQHEPHTSGGKGGRGQLQRRARAIPVNISACAAAAQLRTTGQHTAADFLRAHGGLPVGGGQAVKPLAALPQRLSGGDRLARQGIAGYCEGQERVAQF